MSIKITTEEKEYIEKLIKSYQEVHTQFTKIELEVADLQSKQQDLMKNYDKLNDFLTDIKSEERLFLAKMKGKYPGIKNLTELIE